MKRIFRNGATLELACVLMLAAANAAAITAGPFGASGQGGSKNGQPFTIGGGGSVFELAAFVSLAGADLNGAETGSAAELGLHALPVGLGYTFSSQLSTDAVDLTLTYTFVNQSGGGMTNLNFAVMLDAEIDQEANTFFNEYGATSGSLGHGSGDASADSWQIDEPGFQSGTLFKNLFANALSRSNAVPQSALNDVALGLGFALGTLQPGESNVVKILISQAGHTRGNFALVHKDNGSNSPTVITLSGESTPNGAVSTFENGTPSVSLTFTWRLNNPTGTLFGTLTLSNRLSSGVSFSAPYQIGMPTSTNFWLASRNAGAGNLPDGVPYVDISAKVNAAPAGNDGVLAPGEKVVLTDAVEIYSRTRAAPPNSLFEFWATRQ